MHRQRNIANERITIPYRGTTVTLVPFEPPGFAARHRQDKHPKSPVSQAALWDAWDAAGRRYALPGGDTVPGARLGRDTMSDNEINCATARAVGWTGFPVPRFLHDYNSTIPEIEKRQWSISWYAHRMAWYIEDDTGAYIATGPTILAACCAALIAKGE